MGAIAIVLIVVLLVGYYGALARRRGRGIVARRGMGIGADLGSLADAPRMVVATVTRVGAEEVRLVLRPEPGTGDEHGQSPAGLDVVVAIGDDFAFQQLRTWQQTDTVVAMVLPPGGRLLRLRSVEDLQPLTLRMVTDP